MLKWINKKRNTKGFTLIELIVVIAILGILAALAIPRFAGTLKSSKEKTDLATVRVIESAVSLYQAEKGADEEPTIANLKDGYLDANLKWANDDDVAEDDIAYDNDHVITVSPPSYD